MGSPKLEILNKPTLGHGGARPGAGRKPRLQYEARELFYMAIDAQWEEIMAKIRGVAEQGDKDMLRYLIDQRVGRAPQSVDITTQGESLHGRYAGGADIAAIAARAAEELRRGKT